MTDVNEEEVDAFDAEDLQDSLDAEVHVHFRVVDDQVDVGIQRCNIFLGTQIRREEIEILILALHHRLEGVVVRIGEVQISASSDQTDLDDKPPGLDMSTISITYAGSEPLIAMRNRQSLIDLLRGGCNAPASTEKASERPKSKCN